MLAQKLFASKAGLLIQSPKRWLDLVSIVTITSSSCAVTSSQANENKSINVWAVKWDQTHSTPACFPMKSYCSQCCKRDPFQHKKKKYSHSLRVWVFGIKTLRTQWQIRKAEDAIKNYSPPWVIYLHNGLTIAWKQRCWDCPSGSALLSGAQLSLFWV